MLSKERAKVPLLSMSKERASRESWATQWQGQREVSKYSWVTENLRSLKFQASYQPRLNGTLTHKQASGFSLRPSLDNRASTFTGNWQGNFKWIQSWERNTRYIFENTPDMLSQGQFLESDGQSTQMVPRWPKYTIVSQYFTPIWLHFQ